MASGGKTVTNCFRTGVRDKKPHETSCRSNKAFRVISYSTRYYCAVRLCRKRSLVLIGLNPARYRYFLSLYPLGALHIFKNGSFYNAMAQNDSSYAKIHLSYDPIERFTGKQEIPRFILVDIYPDATINSEQNKMLDEIDSCHCVSRNVLFFLRFVENHRWEYAGRIQPVYLVFCPPNSG